MALSLVQRVVAWIRSGYAAGVPAPDYQPLLALLRRRLTAQEVAQVASELAERGLLQDPKVDAGVEITKITDATPSEEDVARVLHRLEEHTSETDVF